MIFILYLTRSTLLRLIGITIRNNSLNVILSSIEPNINRHLKLK